MFTHLRSITLALIVGITCCNGYKGLFVMTFGSKSHMNFYSGIVETLVENGHQMTFINSFENTTKFDGNARYIAVKETYFDEIIGNAFEASLVKLITSARKYTPKVCAEAFLQPDIVAAMKDDFDFVVLSLFAADCFLGYAYERKIPIIFATPNAIYPPYTDRVGQIDFPSVYTTHIAEYSHPLSFTQRIGSIMADTVGRLINQYVDNGIEQLTRELGIWSPNIPPLSELRGQTSLLLINSIRALEKPAKSTPPTVIYAGGLHIKPAKPLPQDLDDWLTASGRPGFILFSLGTAVKPSQMEERQLKTLLKVFRSLDQRVIWKWDKEDMKDLPPNVKLSSWLPQIDILAHPQIRLFITHGGVFSLQEASQFGVPVIGMPVFGDQENNIAGVTKDGWGLKVLWKDLTEEKLRQTISEILGNDSYRQAVKQRSTLMNDIQKTPKEEVAFWVEYVVRHKGAKHLQSPLVFLPWYKIFNIDVWIFLIAMTIALLIISYFVAKMCIKFIIRRCHRLLNFKWKSD